MKKQYIIDGENFSNFEEFIKEFNTKVFNSDNWHGNLDTLDDMLYGGYNTPEENEEFTIIWKNAHKSAKDLGVNEYLRWKTDGVVKEKADESIKKEIELAKLGIGVTMFLLLVDIIAGHKNIELILN